MTGAPAADQRAVLALAVAGVVTGVAGVARLADRSVPAGVELATHYPGGKVTGVRIVGDTVSVHLVADRLPLPAVAGEARAAAEASLASLGARHRVDVVVEDLEVDELPPRDTEEQVVDLRRPGRVQGVRGAQPSPPEGQGARGALPSPPDNRGVRGPQPSPPDNGGSR